jgi:hypothetical protein
MTVQTDVRSATRTSDGTLVGARARIKAMTITCSASAGSVVLKDGGSSGTTKVEINPPALAEIFNVAIPAEGVLFETDVYVDVTNVSSITVFYG